MRRALVLFAGLIGLVALFVGVAFVIQNSMRTTELSLDLIVVAYRLKQPVSVVALVGGALAAGLALPTVFLGYANWSLKSQIRSLKRQLAVSDAGGF